MLCGPLSCLSNDFLSVCCVSTVWCFVEAGTPGSGGLSTNPFPAGPSVWRGRCVVQLVFSLPSHKSKAVLCYQIYRCCRGTLDIMSDSCIAIICQNFCLTFWRTVSVEDTDSRAYSTPVQDLPIFPMYSFPRNTFICFNIFHLIMDICIESLTIRIKMQSSRFSNL